MALARGRGRTILAGGLLLRRFVGEGSFSFGEHGKPFLPGGPAFSLSHSGSLAVLAVSGGDVGADAERVAPVREPLLSRVLTEAERRWAAEDPERRFAFLWTRKEAALKYLGCGIARPLRALSVLPGEVPVLDGGPVRLRTVEYNGYMISAAAAEDPAFTPLALRAEDLFS